ncbi:unannotated protein [freshwater metagenome]|uniref:Unannotated protein n=1 Tax=freshwater metagenome TaxID=449393 RepID=A0A6J6X7L6_9ZZZZ
MAESGTQVRAPEIATRCILAGVLSITKHHPKGRSANVLGCGTFAVLIGLFIGASKSQWWLFHGGFALVDDSQPRLGLYLLLR